MRWGILSTANIVVSSFLPGLRAAGSEAWAVASRDGERARQFAAANGIAHAVEGYRQLLEDPAVEAVYIPLPNSLHAKWTLAALRAGKPVLCEKPLCASVAETETVLGAGGLLWEAFVFPFGRYWERVLALLPEIGDLREIHASFHFRLARRPDIRLQPALAGGALNDLGCYPVHLATLLFGGAPLSAKAAAHVAPEGVDDETQGICTFPGDRRLLFTCGFLRQRDSFTRLLGSDGEIRLSFPFHPGPADTIQLHAGGRVITERPAPAEPSFAAAIRHIEAVVAGGEAPLHLARDEALATARALELVRRG